MGRRTLLNTSRIPNLNRQSARERGWSLVEMTITLVLLMGIALFGMKTMVSGFLLQNWSIAQTMADACAGMETAYAQREVFANIPTNGRWGIYPASITKTGVIIGQTAFQPMKVNLTRTYHVYAPDPVTGAISYLLESYVVFTSGPRTYCKVSKVYRSQ